jgi:hypothetical protein
VSKRDDDQHGFMKRQVFTGERSAAIRMRGFLRDLVGEEAHHEARVIAIVKEAKGACLDSLALE